MSRKTFIPVLLGVVLLAATAFAKDNSKAFLKTAARSGAAEIAQARLALTMASNPDIQAFAKGLIADHEAVNAKVEALARTHGVTLPTELSGRDKAGIKRLSKLNDRNRSFDREYLSLTLKKHEASIKAFEKQAEKGTDAGVRELARETLPKLKAHRDEAAALGTRLNLKSNE